MAIAAVAVVERRGHLAAPTAEGQRLHALASQRADRHDAHLTALPAFALAGADRRAALFREEPPDDPLRLADKGPLVRQAPRAVFEAAVTCPPATGIPEAIANDKVTRSESAKATATHSSSSGSRLSAGRRGATIFRCVRLRSRRRGAASIPTRARR